MSNYYISLRSKTTLGEVSFTLEEFINHYLELHPEIELIDVVELPYIQLKGRYNL